MSNNTSRQEKIRFLKNRLKFAADRDSDNKLYSPKNLSMALIAQVGELAEHFQWLTEEQSKNIPPEKLQEIEAELANILIYLIRLSDKLGVELTEAAERKITENEKKYPAE